ncbi:MAG: sigma 54-interacting transcriptional regulator [Polyangiaceae bacterium]
MSKHQVSRPQRDLEQETAPATVSRPGSRPLALTLRVTGDDFSATYRLDLRRTVLVGRSRDADIQIDHVEVSRRHLLLHTGPPLRVEDLGSSNGTEVRRVRLTPHEPVEIAAGDPVRIGSLVLLFRWSEIGPPSAGDIAETSRSPAMAKLHAMVDRVAPARINVLIHGETGVGKEVLAETIHKRSPRADKPFIRLNCGGFSETLLESELFGHEKGAFTGAAHTKPGLLESAEGGTVLLDEIGELPMSLQVKLLRVLEERRVRRVGGLDARPIDVRFLAATHRDLEGDVAKGTFRQDLLFRLNGMTLTIPPLRERTEEIEALAELFLARVCENEGHPKKLTLSPEALRLLLRYRWPGNVRELRNVMERAALLVRGNVITCEDLPAEKMEASVSAAGSSGSGDLGGDMGPKASARPSQETVPPPPESASERPAAPVLFWTRGKPNPVERQAILDALHQCKGNQTKAASLLGISRGTLVTRLELYGLPRPRGSSRGKGEEPE